LLGAPGKLGVSLNNIGRRASKRYRRGWDYSRITSRGNRVTIRENFRGKGFREGAKVVRFSIEERWPPVDSWVPMGAHEGGRGYGRRRGGRVKGI